MKKEHVTEEIVAPSYVQYEEEAEVTAFVVEDGNKDERIIYSSELVRQIQEDAKIVEKQLASKSFEGSNQDLDELGQFNIFNSSGTIENKIAKPPYSPDCMANFLEVDDIHFRAVKTKVTDSVGKNYKFKSSYPITEASNDKEEISVTQQDLQKEVNVIKKFIKNCNDSMAFEDICFKAGMDKEGIGWGAFEVIRNAEGKIAKLNHMPATRLRVLEGFTGFVEIHGATLNKYTYYLPFGKKVLKRVQNPLNPTETILRPYNPDEDGELKVGSNDLEFNFVDRTTGKTMESGNISEKFNTSANEVLFIPTPHSNTIYYGYSDAITAIGAIVANSYIRDYVIQFFEHNCVPRYAVIIKGARVDDEFKKLIYDHFENKIKGAAHKTLILTIAGMANKNIEIEFKKIDADRKESDFLETRKANNQITMTAHGTSAAILGINETANLGSGKGLSQAEMYKDRIVRPLQLSWARHLNKLFRLGLGVRFAEIEFDPFDVRDQLTSAQALNLFLQSGVMTINEARSELGVGGPLEGGDEAFVRVREGSAVLVSELPNIKSKLQQQESEGKVEDIEVGE